MWPSYYMEEMKSSSSIYRMCPYYLAKELKSNADVIFMPYNYILDLKIRIESCDCHMMWISPFFVCCFADSADAWCGCGRDCGDIRRGSQHSE